MTSCFVYKVMGLTFHDRIKTQLINKNEIAQVVARRITKPQRIFLGSNLTGCSFLFIFLIFFFWRAGGGGGGGKSDFIILFMSYFFLFIYFLYYFFYFLSLQHVPVYGTYIKTSVTTQATVNSEIHANVSVKRHICDVKICD